MKKKIYCNVKVKVEFWKDPNIPFAAHCRRKYDRRRVEVKRLEKSGRWNERRAFIRAISLTALGGIEWKRKKKSEHGRDVKTKMDQLSKHMKVKSGPVQAHFGPTDRRKKGDPRTPYDDHRSKRVEADSQRKQFPVKVDYLSVEGHKKQRTPHWRRFPSPKKGKELPNTIGKSRIPWKK